MLAVGRTVYRIAPEFAKKLEPLYPFAQQKAGRLATLKTKNPKTALISSAGLYLDGSTTLTTFRQKPFDYKNFYGDAAGRVFPSDFSLSELRLTESDFDRTGFDNDPASLFPLPELKQVLPEFGGELAEHHFSLLGFCLKQEELLEQTVPEILKILKEDKTGLALLIPACVVCHEVLPKVAEKLESAGMVTVTFAFIPKAVETVKAPRTILFDGDCGLPFGHSASVARKELLRLAMKAAFEMKTAGEVWRFLNHRETAPGTEKKNGTAIPVR